MCSKLNLCLYFIPFIPFNLHYICTAFGQKCHIEISFMKKYLVAAFLVIPVLASAQSSGFYNNSTLTAVLVLSLVLLLIAGLLYGINRNLKSLAKEKNPELVEPSYYERKIKPVVSKWNPTIVTLIVMGLGIVILGGWGYKFGMTEVGVQQGYAPAQPINFSHKIHAGDLELDCKYCHSTADKSKSASIPSLNTCMNCHKYVQATEKYNGKISPEIQKIYNAIGFNGEKREYIPGFEQKPVEWVRIHNLPDLAYFNHSQHVKVAGLECQTCHGQIQEMEKVAQHSTLQMGWCIDCHRNRGINLDNNYYEQVHEKAKKEGKYHVTVADNGGLECGKCHY